MKDFLVYVFWMFAVSLAFVLGGFFERMKLEEHTKEETLPEKIETMVDKDRHEDRYEFSVTDSNPIVFDKFTGRIYIFNIRDRIWVEFPPPPFVNND